MKSKRTRWERDPQGRPVLVEFYEDEGPSSARGVSRNPTGFNGTGGAHARAGSRLMHSKPVNTRPQPRTKRTVRNNGRVLRPKDF